MTRHSVQFFDGPDTLGADVAAFFRDGLDAGAHLLLLARPAHVEAVADALNGYGLSMPALQAEGRLTLMDPAATLQGLMFNGRPHPDGFDKIIAEPVRALARRGPVRVYGELVDMLASAGNLRASVALEQLWNRLLETTPVQLHCGYTSANFADDRYAGAMRAICHQHTHSSANPSDLLADWLLSRHLPAAS